MRAPRLDRGIHEPHQRGNLRFLRRAAADADGLIFGEPCLLAEQRVRREAVIAAIGFAHRQFHGLDFGGAKLPFSRSAPTCSTASSAGALFATPW